MFSSDINLNTKSFAVVLLKHSMVSLEKGSLQVNFHLVRKDHFERYFLDLRMTFVMFE